MLKIKTNVPTSSRSLFCERTSLEKPATELEKPGAVVT